MAEDETPRDWRGTEIKVGSPVIYGGPVGRSIQLVEGEVVGFTKAGRVNVRVVRRAYTSGWSSSKRVVHVGADRLVVINPDGLPPTDLPTWDEKIDEAERTHREHQRLYATHDFPPSHEEVQAWASGSAQRYPRWVYPPCTRCGVTTSEGYRQACTS